MKVAIFTDLFLEIPGGIPSSVKAQKKALEEAGHEAVVFCPGREVSTDRTICVVPTFRFLRIGGAPTAKLPGRVERFIEQEYPDFGQEFDLVHVHYEAAVSMAGVRLARKYGLPVVQTMHGREDVAVATNIPHPFKWLSAWFLAAWHGKYIPHRKKVMVDNYLAPSRTRAKMWTLMRAQAQVADVVVMPSHHFVEKFRHYGVTRPMVVVSNGVADGLVNSEWPVRKLAEGETLRMIWTSRVSKEKRILPFLEALASLTEKNWRLDVFGDGNEMGRARRFVREHGLEKRVKFHGMVAHEKLLMKQREAHLSVMTSYGFDNQSMTLLEAVAAGLPVLYCDPDMTEVMPLSGAVMAEGPEPEQLAAVVRRILAEPRKIEKMSRVMLDCRGDALQSKQLKRLLALYGALVEGGVKALQKTDLMVK